MTITFIGHGYVGLVTATVFADLGNKVYVIGHTPKKVEDLKKGILPIYEPGLEELVARNLKAGRLLFTLDYTPAISSSDVIFIAVGTPPKENGEADLSVVYEVAEKVGKHLNGYTVINVKSTVPVGTNLKVKELIEKVKPADASFDIASVPEFLREGQAIEDTFHPDRIIIGIQSKKAEGVLVNLHKPIIENKDNRETQLFLTTIESAEMIKYASNAFLATKISFANSIALICEKVGADGPSVLKAVGLDKRIGKSFLNAGAGYGGSCFPKDVKALIQIAKQHGFDFKLLKEVEQINEEAIYRMAKKAKSMVGGNLSGKRIAVLGLSFKPDTDDMRDAPSIIVVKALIAGRASVHVYDPIASENAKKIFSHQADITYHANVYTCVQGADLMIIMTEWNEFREIDLVRVKQTMNMPRILDGRNIYNPQQMKELEFEYQGVGR